MSVRKPMHRTVKAADLRDGDLMRVGVSTNYVVVANAEQIDGRVEVTVYNGDRANAQPTLVFAPDADVALSTHAERAR